MNQLLQELEKEKERLQKLILHSEQIIMNAPQGKVRVSKCKNSKQFYYRETPSESPSQSILKNTSHKISETPNGQYMKKEETQIANKIIEREYYEKLLKACYKQKNEIEKMIEFLKKTALENVYDSMSKMKQECFEPIVLSERMFRQQWESKTYEGKGFSEDYPEIYSDKGERVRSKTEKIIADKLYKEGIPYRYEEPIELSGYGLVYPDFKLLDVEKRQEIILEHFGMMDDEIYASKALKKLRMYEKSGFIVGKNLLLTFETSAEPFDSRQFDRMLKAYNLKSDMVV